MGVSPKIDLIEMNRIFYRLLLAFTQLAMRMTNFSSTAARSFYHQIYPPKYMAGNIFWQAYHPSLKKLPSPLSPSLITKML